MASIDDADVGQLVETANAFWRSSLFPQASSGLPDLPAFSESSITTERVLLPSCRHGKTKATPFDFWEAKFIRHFNWYFDVCPDERAMKTALVSTLCSYPEIAGRLSGPDEADTEHPFFTFDHSRDDAGVDFQVLTLPNYAANRLASLSNDDELYAVLNEDLDHFQSPRLDFALYFPADAQMMSVRLTRFPRPDGSSASGLLSVCLHHSVADACSGFELIVEWAKNTRSIVLHTQQQQPFQPTIPSSSSSSSSIDLFPDRKTVVDRYGLIRQYTDFTVPFPYSESRQQAIGWKLGSLHEMLAVRNTGGQETRRPSTARRLLVTQEIVRALKGLALAGSKGEELRQQGVLSTNDVMCALLLYGEALFASETLPKGHHHPPLQVLLKQLIVVNSRSRLGIASYFGNSVAHLLLEFTVESVLESSFSELCLAVRRGVAGFDAQMVKEGNAAFYTVVEEERPEAVLRLAIPSFTGFVTNWSSFDIFGNDFGTGRPSVFLRKDFVSPGFYFAVPHPTIQHASFWHLSLHPPIADWLDKLNLTDPASFLPRA